MKTRLSATEKKKFIQRQKKLAAIKTAVPLVLTLLLFVVLYILVLRPEEPQNILKRAIINSSDSSKYKSVRYNGSFGDTDRGLRAEYSGQVSSNGDKEFRFRLNQDEVSSTVEVLEVGSKKFIKLSGTENLKSITSKITGAKVPDDELVAVLGEVQNTWIIIDDTSLSLVSDKLACINELPVISENKTIKLDDTSYPFIYKSGPVSPKDDSGDQIYEVDINPQASTGGLADPVLGFVSCMELNYASDDFRLREVGQADVNSAKITVQINPISSTVTNMTYKQVGAYFKINFKDYNKDISLTEPSDYKTQKELLQNLSSGAMQYLTRLSF